MLQYVTNRSRKSVAKARQCFSETSQLQAAVTSYAMATAPTMRMLQGLPDAQYKSRSGLVTGSRRVCGSRWLASCWVYTPAGQMHGIVDNNMLLDATTVRRQSCGCQGSKPTKAPLDRSKQNVRRKTGEKLSHMLQHSITGDKDSSKVLCNGATRTLNRNSTLA